MNIQKINPYCINSQKSNYAKSHISGYFSQDLKPLSCDSICFSRIKAPAKIPFSGNKTQEDEEFRLPTDEEFAVKKVELENIIKNNPIFKNRLGYVNLTKENILVAEKIINSPGLMEGANFSNNMEDIICNTDTAEHAKAKIDIIDCINQNPELMDYESFDSSIGYIVRITDTAEHAKAKIDIVNRINQNPGLMNYKNFENTLPDIIYCTETAESAKARTDVLDCINQNPEILKSKNFVDKMGDIIFGLYTAEESEIITKIMQACAKALRFNENQDIQNNIGNIVKRNITRIQAEKIIEKISNSNTIAYPKLTQLLSNELISAKQLSKLLTEFPATNRNVGHLPNEFLINTEKGKEPEVSQKFCDILGNFAKMKDPKEVDYENFSQQLSQVLKCAVNIEYIGRGWYGIGYKLTVADKNYFLKTFDHEESAAEHGKHIEIQSALYANNHGRENQFTNFFFGRVATHEDNDAFLVGEFLTLNTKNPTLSKKSNPIVSSMPAYADFVTVADKSPSTNGTKGHNTMNGKIFDFGRFKKRTPELENKKLRQNVRIIGERVYLNRYRDDTIEYKLSQNNAKILKDYAKKNMSKQDYNKAVDIYLKAMQNKTLSSDVVKQLIDITKELG